MLLNSVPHSPYDLHFSILHFPVRVSWTFWLFSAALGYDSARALDGHFEVGRATSSPGTFAFLLVWVLASFVSILIHELGHTLAFRMYGVDSHIELYHMGGLAIPTSFTSWRGARTRRLTAQNDLVISAAGPFVQLAAGLLVGFGVLLAGFRPSREILWLAEVLRLPVGDRLVDPESPIMFAAIHFFLYPSIWWAILNLIPVYPLDGGQILKSILSIAWRRDALYEAAGVGAVLGILVGVWGMQTGQSFLGIFFIMLGISNIQLMQTRGMGGPW